MPEEVRRAAGLLEGRWTVSILWASAEGASRFNEFKQAVGEIPPRTLAQRLLELEDAGLLERRVIDARPPRVEYVLTDEGQRLRAVVDALAAYAGALGESALERCAPVREDGRAVRGQDALDRQLEKRREVAPSWVRPPRSWIHEAGHRLRPSEPPMQHVAGDDRACGLEPVDDLLGDGRGDGRRTPCGSRSPIVRPDDPRVVARRQLRLAASVPLAREQDRDGQANPCHVAVERLEEARALRLVRRDERIDEHDRVLRLPVDTADVAVPVVAFLPVRDEGRSTATARRRCAAPPRSRSDRTRARRGPRPRPMRSSSVQPVERAQQPELDPVAAADRAVAEERRRIARELHDVVAHSVSVMTVQAGAVRRLLRPDQERERQALEVIEATGREALTEMRRLVGLLREQGAMPEFAPQPSMRTVDVLVGTVREAGLPVEIEIEGEPRELPPGVDLSAYRIIQEALTNALRYAGPAHAWVTVRWKDRELELEIANDGRSEPGREGVGHGLAGLRERVALVGGSIESGPRSGGGYVVRAHLPLRGAA